MNRRSPKTSLTKSCTPIRRILSTCLSARVTPSLTGRPLGMVTTCTSPPGGVSPPQLQSYSQFSPISSLSLCPVIRLNWVVREPERYSYYNLNSFLNCRQFTMLLNSGFCLGLCPLPTLSQNLQTQCSTSTSILSTISIRAVCNFHLVGVVMSMLEFPLSN
jgi:hypothetical protein